MSNARLRTLSIGVFMLAALLVVAATVRVPLVALLPGPPYDTLGEAQGKPVISVTGRPVYPTTGRLEMTTVSVADGLTALNALAFWTNPQAELFPRALIYPPGLTDAQVNQSNSQMFSTSESYATVAALRYLREPIEVVVGQLTAASPAGSVLKLNDRLLEVNGEAITSATQVRTIMTRTRPGDRVPITYQRGDAAPVTGVVTVGVRPGTEDGTSGGTPDGPQGFLGIVAHSEGLPPGQIKVALDDVGGPSAGLMFTLGIIDKITPMDLAGGRFVAGTGSIDEFGNVGAIGGIPLKMIGAKKMGATIFLVPADNCAEAKSAAPSGLRLIKVATATDAVKSLNALKAGQPVPGC